MSTCCTSSIIVPKQRFFRVKLLNWTISILHSCIGMLMNECVKRSHSCALRQNSNSTSACYTGYIVTKNAQSSILLLRKLFKVSRTVVLSCIGILRYGNCSICIDFWRYSISLYVITTGCVTLITIPILSFLLLKVFSSNVFLFASFFSKSID